MKPMVDFLGRPICEGDYIIFPGRYSSSMWLSLARVISVTNKIVIRSVTRGWDGKLAPAKKTSVLQVYDRCVVIPADRIPNAFMEATHGQSGS